MCRDRGTSPLLLPCLSLLLLRSLLSFALLAAAAGAARRLFCLPLIPAVSASLLVFLQAPLPCVACHHALGEVASLMIVTHLTMGVYEVKLVEF